MRLPPFDFFEPTSIQEACEILAEDPDGSMVFAGGTDVLVSLKEGLVRPRRLVALGCIEDLTCIEHSESGNLVIGAMATVNEVARHDAVGRHYPGIVEAAHCLAADQVRNLATVGGNLCHGVPSADMAPILLAYDTRLYLHSCGGEREVALREFFVGPRRTVLEPGDVLVRMEVPAPVRGQGAAYERQGGRVSLSLPWASAAAVVRLEEGLCTSAALALGAVAPTPMMVAGVPGLLLGTRLDSELLVQAGELAAAEARPIDDFRSSRAYRLELIKVLSRRALSRAAARAVED